MPERERLLSSSGMPLLSALMLAAHYTAVAAECWRGIGERGFRRTGEFSAGREPERERERPGGFPRDDDNETEGGREIAAAAMLDRRN